MIWLKEGMFVPMRHTEVDGMWNKLSKNDRRLLNCFLFTIMSPVGFLLGWYVAMEQWALVIFLMAATMALDFIGSYTYMDIIGDRFENEFEKAQGKRGSANSKRGQKSVGQR